MEYRQLPRLNICFRLGKEVTDDHGWVQTSEIKDGDVKGWKKNTCKAERLESESLKVKVKVWKKNTCKAGRLESESLKEEHLQGWTAACRASASMSRLSWDGEDGDEVGEDGGEEFDGEGGGEGGFFSGEGGGGITWEIRTLNAQTSYLSFFFSTNVLFGLNFSPHESA